MTEAAIEVTAMTDAGIAWIGFIGSVIGAALAGLVALCVMWRTNESNKRIQIKNQRFVFCSEVCKLIAEYCIVVTESFYAHRQIFYSLKFLELDPQNKSTHLKNEKLSRSQFESEHYKAQILFYDLEIRLKTVKESNHVLKILQEVQKRSTDTEIDKDKFEAMTAELRTLTTDFITEYTQ